MIHASRGFSSFLAPLTFQTLLQKHLQMALFTEAWQLVWIHVFEDFHGCSTLAICSFYAVSTDRMITLNWQDAHGSVVRV